MGRQYSAVQMATFCEVPVLRHRWPKTGTTPPFSFLFPSPRSHIKPSLRSPLDLHSHLPYLLKCVNLILKLRPRAPLLILGSLRLICRRRDQVLTAIQMMHHETVAHLLKKKPTNLRPSSVLVQNCNVNYRKHCGNLLSEKHR